MAGLAGGASKLALEFDGIVQAFFDHAEVSARGAGFFGKLQVALEKRRAA